MNRTSREQAPNKYPNKHPNKYPNKCNPKAQLHRVAYG